MSTSLHPELCLLVGSWRLLSFGSTFTDTKERVEPFGPTPEGYMICEPGGRIMFFFARPDRQPATDDAGRVAVLGSMMAYTGLVRWDGPGRLVTTVDLAWLPEWRGEQLRFFQIAGDRLTIRSAEYSPPRSPDRTAIGEVVFEREHPIELR